MNEASFASLSPTLLARKGGAKPAMRPQLGPLPGGQQAASNLEDLGWNDMGQDDLDNVVPINPASNDEVPMAMVALAAKSAPKRRSALKRGKRAAFTLRLDAERHLKLRLAATMNDTSAQELVTEALDKLLGDIAGLETLAAQLKKG